MSRAGLEDRDLLEVGSCHGALKILQSIEIKLGRVDVPVRGDVASEWDREPTIAGADVSHQTLWTNVEHGRDLASFGLGLSVLVACKGPVAEGGQKRQHQDDIQEPSSRESHVMRIREPGRGLMGLERRDRVEG